MPNFSRKIKDPNRDQKGQVFCLRCQEWHGGIQCPDPETLYERAAELRGLRATRYHPQGLLPTDVQPHEWHIRVDFGGTM